MHEHKYTRLRRNRTWMSVPKKRICWLIERYTMVNEDMVAEDSAAMVFILSMRANIELEP
jgi:hypothetical protein